MVQITNTLIVVAAVVVPAFTAPVQLEARAGKGGALRTLGKIAGGAASGASLGLTVAPLFQQPRELEQLEARITGAQAKAMAKGAGKIAHVAKSGIEFGSAVAPMLPHRQPRSLEELEYLEARITGAQAKAMARGAGQIAHYAKSGIEFGATVAPMLPHKQRRSFDDELIPRFRVSSNALKNGGKALTGAAGFAGTVAVMNTQPRQREFDELEVREPFRVSSNALKAGGKALAGAAGFAGTVAVMNTQPHQREFNEVDEVDAREPIFGAIIKGVSKVAGKVFGGREDKEEFFGREFEDENLYVRELDAEELDAREPIFGAIVKGVAKVAGKLFRREDGKEFSREFLDEEFWARAIEDELDAREPGFGSIFKGVGKVVGKFIREDEGEEFVAREPGFGSVIKGVGKVVGKFIREDEGEEYFAREFEIDELD